MGKENVFPLRKEKGRMKNIKKKIWTDESKKVMTEGWKKKWRNTKSEKHKKRCFWNGRFTKKAQKIENEKKQKKRKNTMKQKKGKIHRKKRSKNRYSFKRRRSKKIGETRIEYKRDVKHIKSSKTYSKIKVFFFLRKNRRKNDETFQKRRVSLVQEAEKTKNWRCKKRPQKFKKKEEEIKNTCT